MKQWYVKVFVCYHISYIRFTVSSFMLCGLLLSVSFLRHSKLLCAVILVPQLVNLTTSEKFPSRKSIQ
jgi:hypothetical protein